MALSKITSHMCTNTLGFTSLHQCVKLQTHDIVIRSSIEATQNKSFFINIITHIICAHVFLDKAMRSKSLSDFYNT